MSVRFVGLHRTMRKAWLPAGLVAAAGFAASVPTSAQDVSAYRLDQSTQSSQPSMPGHSILVRPADPSASASASETCLAWDEWIPVPPSEEELGLELPDAPPLARVAANPLAGRSGVTIMPESANKSDEATKAATEPTSDPSAERSPELDSSSMMQPGGSYVQPRARRGLFGGGGWFRGRSNGSSW